MLPLIPSWVHEVILVNDQSIDNTLEVARRALPSIRIINTQCGHGKGAALRSGFAAATGDIEATIMAEVTHALLDSGEGYTARALGRLEQLRPLAYTNETALAHAYAGMFHANMLAVVGRLDDATARVAEGIGRAGREGNSLALTTWAVYSGWVHLAAGRLSAARDAAESLPPPSPTGASEQDVHPTLPGHRRRPETNVGASAAWLVSGHRGPGSPGATVNGRRPEAGPDAERKERQ